MLKILYFHIILSFLSKNSNTLSIKPCSQNGDIIDINTKSGPISGSCVPNNPNNAYSTVFSWLSVPYAEPPINEKRFRPPEPVKSWTDTLDATKLPNACMQSSLLDQSSNQNLYQIKNDSNIKISEDCLYLNIWTPLDAYLARFSESFYYGDPKVPILVFFHGGNNNDGTSVLDIYNPSEFVLQAKVIVITVNYRLGAFGFLHFNDQPSQGDSIGGNLGILDQHLALKWIYENAEYFGGDKDKITISGQGSGAALANYHLIYEPSWKYFRNGIFMGGSFFNLPYSPISSLEATRRTKKFALEYVGCGTNKEKYVQCLQNVNAEKLIEFERKFLNGKLSDESGKNWAAYLTTAFPPVIDNLTITEKPIESFNKGKFKKCNIITGFNANEGVIYLSKLNKSNISNIQLKDFIDIIKDYYPIYASKPSSFGKLKLILNSILFEYAKITFKNSSDSSLDNLDYFKILESFIGDEYIKCPSLKLADYYYHSNTNNVYVYLYNHRISSSIWPNEYGVVNGDEIAMTFAHVFSGSANRLLSGTLNPWSAKTDTYTENEKLLSKTIVSYWSNFIVNDDPNSKVQNHYGDKIYNINWSAYTPSARPFIKTESSAINHNIVEFNSHGASARRIDFEKCHFWNTFFPQLLNDFGDQTSYFENMLKSINSLLNTKTTNKYSSPKVPSKYPVKTTKKVQIRL